jgi:hypothetical protein
VRVLRAIADAAPGVAIRVYTYPAPPDRPCLATGWLGEADLRLLRELVVERANVVIRRAALLAGALGLDVRVIDVESAFLQHGVCDASSVVNGLLLDASFPLDVARTFMPTASGQTLLGLAEAEGGRSIGPRTVLTPDAQLSRGGTQRESIVVDGGPLVVSIARNPGVTVTLWRPDGTPEPAATRFVLADRDILLVDAPPAGTWTVELHADNSAPLAALTGNGRQPPIRLVVASAGPALPLHAAASVSVRGRAVAVDAAPSRFADGIVAAAEWDWGDGTPAVQGLQATHTYARTGAYRVSLTVTDAAGRTDLTRIVVVVVGARTVRGRPVVQVSRVRRTSKMVVVRLRCPADAAFSCHAVAEVRAARRSLVATGGASANPKAPLTLRVPIDGAFRAGLRNGTIRQLRVRVIVGDDSSRAPLVLRVRPVAVRARR